METKKTQKNPSFFCEKCDFITNNKKDYTRHINTPKHKWKHSGEIGNKKNPFICKNCNKVYISRSGLYKHSKKCLESNVSYTDKCFQSNNMIGNNQNVLDEIAKQHILKNRYKDNPTNIEKTKKNENNQMYSLIMKQGEILESLIKKIGEVPSNNRTSYNTPTHTINHTINHNNNTTNQINLHLYLNETCKGAGNLFEFIENIRLQLSDLISVKNDGLLNSTKNIILKELQNTEPIKRPIQCTDIKRKTLYVKEEGEWSKDVGNEKLKGAIRSLSQKHIPLVKNLTCQEGEKPLNSEEYVQVVKSATTDVLEETRGLQSAVREICQETYMKGGVE